MTLHCCLRHTGSVSVVVRLWLVSRLRTETVVCVCVCVCVCVLNGVPTALGAQTNPLFGRGGPFGILAYGPAPTLLRHLAEESRDLRRFGMHALSVIFVRVRCRG